jgi:vitamin B12 transporter
MNNTIKLSMVCAALSTSLFSQTVELEDITVVSATKNKQSINDVTSNINIITAVELEEKHFTTVTEALNTISGINFTQNGGIGQVSSVQLRGFDSKRVLVLIDGIRYNDVTGLSGAPFEHLMVQDIERIEIIKGAQSGIWGADASAGVINIITKDAKKGFGTSANLEYGSFNTKKYSLLGSYRSDNYYVKLSGLIVDSEGFSAQAPKDADLDSLEDDAYKNTTANIKLGFIIDDGNKLDFSHSYVTSETDYDDNVYDAFWNKDAIVSANSIAQAKVETQLSKISFEHINDLISVELYASQSKFSREYSYGDFDGEVMEYGLKSNLPYKEKDFISIGIDHKSFGHKNDLDKKYDNTAVFITNSNQLADTIFTQSLRYDDYSEFSNKTTGKIGLKHNIYDALSLSANYGSAYNVPTLYQLFEPSSAWGPVGNEDLKAENTTSYDLSLQYRSLKLTYFMNKIDDMIDWGNGFENIEGTSTIQGFEFEYKKEIISNLLLNTNYTYLDALDKDDKLLPRRAKHSAYASLDYYATQDLHIGLDAQYIGVRYDAADKSGEQTGKYTLADIVINYTIGKNFKTYLKIDNITDEEYQIVDGYATAPRSFYIGLNASY